MAARSRNELRVIARRAAGCAGCERTMRKMLDEPVNFYPRQRRCPDCESWIRQAELCPACKRRWPRVWPSGRRDEGCRGRPGPEHGCQPWTWDKFPPKPTERRRGPAVKDVRGSLSRMLEREFPGCEFAVRQRCGRDAAKGVIEVRWDRQLKVRKAKWREAPDEP